MSSYVDKDGNVKEIDDVIYQMWVDTGNPKAQCYQKVTPPPTPEALDG